VGYGPTLTDALGQVFTGLPGQTGGGGTGGGGQVSAAVQALLQQAEQDYTQAQDALRRGDFAAYGTAIGKMKQALDAARQAAGKGHAPAAVPTPAPSAPATPSPSASAGR
jgi:uncharacterized membrane protein (UPF0182 family)